MPQSARSKGLGGSAAALALAATLGAGAYWSIAHANSDPHDLSKSVAAAPILGAPSFAPLIERVAPAVVSIDVERRAGRQDVALSEDGGGAPFQFLFPFGGQGQQGDNPFQGLMPNIQNGRMPKEQITGSGFLISPDGYIVTNNHVVEGATKITVRMADKRQLTAKLIGRDPATDLAVIKIDGGDFSYVSFEDRAKPHVGDWVIAVGNPYDLGGTATAGIVSALGRQNVSGSSFVDYMQIDAPINRGNSGGPTFNTSGRVVGVNSAIYSPTGGSVGIGFAIPADVAETVTRQLISHGKVSRGYIGATIQSMTPDIAASLGIPANTGALVADVTAGGPSARAGLQQGDVIEAVEGQPVASAEELTQRVALAQVGQDVHLKVLRDGRTLNLTVRAGLRPSEAQLTSNLKGDDLGDQGDTPQSSGANVLGMQLGRLSEETRQEYGITDQKIGVVVEGVRPDTDAQEKGLQPGDVIVKAGTRKVQSASDVSSAVADARRDHRSAVLLMVARNGRTSFVPVKVTDAAS